MKYIKYLVVFFLSFVFIATDVDASQGSGWAYNGIPWDASIIYYNSETNKPLNPTSFLNNYNINAQYFPVKANQKFGIGVSHNFVANYMYDVSVYVCFQKNAPSSPSIKLSSQSVVANTTASGNKLIYQRTSYSGLNKFPTDEGDNFPTMNSCKYVDTSVVTSKTDSWFGFTFQNGADPQNVYVLGVRINGVGPYSETSNGDIITSINSNVNNVGSSINNNINDMKDQVDNSLNSDNSDTSSTKCGVICKLKGIFTGITNLPKLIWNFMKSGFDAITKGLTNLGDLIGGFFDKLLTGIIDGLKSLFVPTDAQLLEIINDSKELSENFGFVGESVNFFLNIFTSLLGLVNANGCLELPKFEIGATSLFDAHVFWNSQQVCLNDNVILANNITTIRTITSIALVCLFINFASSKFFNIISKVDSDDARTDSYDIK